MQLDIMNNYNGKCGDGQEVKVSVRCATYNHVNYIRQCLDGFVMQKTDFRFEVIVHDDASTDGTTEIVREYAAKYPDIIKPMYENCNQYSVNEKLMNERINARLIGKYIAICEGDDYWIDPLKLQKQVDYLENHSDCTMVCNRAKLYSVELGKYVGEQYCRNSDGELLPKDVINRTGLYIPTCGLVFRPQIRDNYPDYCQNCNVGDYPLKISAAMKGKIYYFDEPMSVYRISHQGSWTSRQKFNTIDRARLHVVRAQMEMFKGFAKDNPVYESIYYRKIMEHLCKNMPDWRTPWKDKKQYSELFSDEIALFTLKWKLYYWICLIPLPKMKVLYKKLFVREYSQLYKMY